LDAGSKVSASAYFLFVWPKQEIVLWITSAGRAQAGRYAVAEPFRRLVFRLTGLPVWDLIATRFDCLHMLSSRHPSLFFVIHSNRHGREVTNR
jgi:hypothetical protein